MAIVSFQPKILENYNAFCSASELYVMNRYEYITSLNNHHSLALLVTQQLLRPCLF